MLWIYNYVFLLLNAYGARCCTKGPESSTMLLNAMNRAGCLMQ